MTYLLIFLASFCNVFFLGLQSQFVRDQRWAVAFGISWGISVSQFLYTWIVANNQAPLATFLAAAWGGSLGIVASVALYRWLQRRQRPARSAAP